MDTLLIAEIVSAIAYIGLHIAYFCADYYTRTVLVTWQDYAVMGLYVCSNFAMLGAFRVTMIRVKWSAAQIIIIKLFVIMSSMAYILVGVIFLFGYDSCSSAFSDFKDSQFNQTVLLSPVRDRERIFDNLKHTTAMALLLNTIQNFVLLYVFANFAFIFELFKKTTDFDGTNFFRTDYKLVDEPRHTQKKT